jgi:biotin carboxyl carrier protein
VAAVAGSTLLVSAAAGAPAAVRWSEREFHSGTAGQTAAGLNDLQANSNASVGQGSATGQINAASNAYNQWSQIPTAQITAARLAAAQRVAAERAVAARAAAQRAAAARAAQQQQAQQAAAAAAAAASYANPLRNVSGLVLERVDMGVDFGGSGPVYALGPGVVTNAEGDNSGWPGGGWITYVAEDVTPDVQVGQTVTSSTVVANMYNGGDGIETGWAMADGASAESEMPEAGDIGGAGPFPTMVGLNFDELLQALGVPAAPNSGEGGNGTLPSGYPTDWASAVKP